MSSIGEWIINQGYPIFIVIGLLIIAFILLYYYIRYRKAEKRYKEYKESQNNIS